MALCGGQGRGKARKTNGWRKGFWIYENQEKWISGSTIDEINNNLKKIVKSFGISNVEFDKCVNNDIIANRILNSRIDAHKKYSIEATPTIVINEKKLKEPNNFNNIIKRIEKLI